MQVKEANVAICVGADQERLELVHGNTEALFFWHDEVDVVFEIEHVPDFDNAIVASAADQVVLVKVVQVARACSHLLVRCKLVRRYVLEVKRRK